MSFPGCGPFNFCYILSGSKVFIHYHCTSILLLFSESLKKNTTHYVIIKIVQYMNMSMMNRCVVFFQFILGFSGKSVSNLVKQSCK